MNLEIFIQSEDEQVSLKDSKGIENYTIRLLRNLKRGDEFLCGASAANIEVDKRRLQGITSYQPRLNSVKRDGTPRKRVRKSKKIFLNLKVRRAIVFMDGKYERCTYVQCLDRKG